jgi:CubicO group peptidase (beta-lactamase class C family)
MKAPIRTALPFEEEQMKPHLLATVMRIAALIAIQCCNMADVAGQTLPPEVNAGIDKAFAAFDRSGSPGCALAVYRDGDIAYVRGYGEANLEHSVPITGRTIFDIGSTSKQFTAFAVLLLEREGKLSLDDDIRKYVPELQPMPRMITIRHLILHTSGLRDYLTLWSLAGMKTANWTTQRDAVQLIARQKQANFLAGDEWLYSNTGYLLLSEIVKRASGKSLPEFASERIFGPLGMVHTFYLDDHSRVVPFRAEGYVPRRGGGFSVEMSDFEQTGDGAVQTSVEDLLLWDRNFYHPRVGDSALLTKAQTVGILTNGKKLDYAAGLTIGAYRGLATVRHGGSWVGYRAELLRFPKVHTSIACLCNLGSANPSALAEKVADLVLAEQLQPRSSRGDNDARAEIKVPIETLAALAGIYEPIKSGTFRRLFVREGMLRAGIGEGQPLKPIAADRFVSAAPGIEFYFPPILLGVARELQVLREGAETESYRLLPAPAPQNLEDFAGRFYSDELDTTWTFATDSRLLTYRVMNDEPISLMPIKADWFLAERGLVVRFERESGKVRRAYIQAGRVTNLLFERR